MGSGADSPCQGEMARRARGGRVGDYEHEVLIRSRPRWRFAQSLVTPDEAQRSGFAGKRRSKGTNAVFAARRKRSGVDFATTSRRGQSHSPPAGGETPPRKEPSSGPMRASGPTKSVLSSPPHPAPSGPPSLSPLAFGHLPLTRGVGPRGEGFRRRAAKPPLRYRGRKPKHRNPCGRADREKKISARRPVWTVNHRRKE